MEYEAGFHRQTVGNAGASICGEKEVPSACRGSGFNEAFVSCLQPDPNLRGR